MHPSRVVLREKPTKVNLEKSLKVGDKLGGHNVSGHIDGTTTILALGPKDDGSRDIWIDLSGFTPPHVIYKGLSMPRQRVEGRPGSSTKGLRAGGGGGGRLSPLEMGWGWEGLGTGFR